jgi:DNA-binding NarL/FixJ family response regulator
MAYEVVGRSDELLALAAFVEDLPSTGQALLLEGDAGIGKTSLWHEGLRLADERHLRVLRSRSSPSETRIAFATIGDLFSPVVDEILPKLVPLQRRALESALLLREAESSPPEARVLGLALVSVVHALAQDRPVLVAIDDLQWVDASSAEVLTFMLRRLDDEPVGVLATARGRPVEAPLELDRAFVVFRRLSVEPLSAGAIHRLLWGRLALSLARPTLIRVHETTGGNPFFALELGRGIVDGSIRADSDDVELPESLSALVAHRLDPLPAHVRDTLVAVAALAAPSVTLLESLGPTVVEDIEIALEHGVLELDGDRIRFTHPLLAPACYSAMPLHGRRRVHRRLADLSVGPEEKARHLAIAAAGPDEEIAEALDAAAVQARARGAAQAAAELAERAVALTPAALVEDVGRRRITAGVLCAFAGDLTRARAVLEEAVDTTAPGPLRAEALCRLADVQDGLDGPSIAANLLVDALAEPGLGRRQRAIILTKLGFFTRVGRVRSDWSRRIEYAGAGLGLAEELAEPELLVASLTVLASLEFWRTGRIQRDLLDRAIELALIRGEPSAGSQPALADPSSPLTHEPRTNLALQLGIAGHFEESRAIWSELIAEQVERDDPNVVWSMLDLASMEVRAGRWEDAAHLCHDAMELNRQMGRELAEPLGLMNLGEINLHRGEAELTSTADLLRAAERLDFEPQTYRLWRVLASLELCRDDPRAAWRRVGSLFKDIDEMDALIALVAGSVAIEALIGIGDLRTAERLLALLDERAAGADMPLRPHAHRCRGLLLSAQGDHERAIVELEAAAAAPASPKEAEPFELARTLLSLGRVRRKAQHKRAARETLERALEMFERLGARPWADKTRSELRRIGGRMASDEQLSETERQVVELVVTGLRNREVADELNLSPNTVAWNLSKIYRKLGVTSRTELAAHVTASRGR